MVFRMTGSMSLVWKDGGDDRSRHEVRGIRSCAHGPHRGAPPAFWVKVDAKKEEGRPMHRVAETVRRRGR